MREIEILEGEKTSDSNKTIKLPANFITVGEIDVDDIKIYIKQDVYNEIEEFSKEDTSNEYGGILIGEYAEINGKKNVIISAFIEAKYTDASASTLTFTHESWNYIHSKQEELYPENKILGWQHTHPSYGIFLSNYDIFIQENFFNLPWQIAYVVDPIADTRGFFQWRDDKVKRTNGFYIFDDIGKKIKIKEAKPSESKEKSKSISLAMILLTTMFLISTVVLGFERFYNIKKINELTAISSKLVQENIELSQKLQQGNEGTQNPQNNNEETQKNDNPQKAQENNNTQKAQENENSPQAAMQGNDNPQKTNVQSNENTNSTIKLKVYTVQAGDTLDKICKGNSLDYSKDREIILKINNITNEDKIYCGQTLYLPVN